MKRILGIIGMIGLTGCGLLDSEPTFTNQYPKVNTALKTFASCDELYAYHNRQTQTRDELNAMTVNEGRFTNLPVVALDSVDSMAMDDGFAESNQITNLQEEGIDEAGMVKVTDKLIITLTRKGLQVNRRRNLENVGLVKIEKASKLAIYTHKIAGEEVLILVGQLHCEGAHSDCQKSLVQFYNVSEDSMIRLIDEVEISGDLNSSRIQNGRLLLVTNKYFVYRRPQYEDCQATYYPVIEDLDTSHVTRIYQFDLLAKNRLTENKVEQVLGSYEDIYVGPNSLYLFNNHIDWIWVDFESRMNITSVLKVQSQEGQKPLVQAMGTIDGSVIGSWAAKEYDDSLVVASTVRRRPTTNHLFVLKQDEGSQVLRLQGQVRDYGVTEDIRAVRYHNRKAYVVTFLQTDPLFVFDLQDLDNPKLMGELKIPGFSTYMHPVGDDRMIGVGFSTENNMDWALFQGIQVSLFDVSDDLNPLAIQQDAYGQRGSYSDAQFDHHAFYFNEEHSFMAMPMVVFDSVDQLRNEPNSLQFAGARVWQVNSDGFEVTAELSHRNFLSENCLQARSQELSWWQSPKYSEDINRIFALDGTLLTVSKHGIKRHELTNPAVTLEAVDFSLEEDTCRNVSYGIGI